MADWAPPDAHNRESSSNSLKSSALWWVSWLVTPVMSKPAAAHHTVNLLEEDTAVNDTWLSESWCSPKLFFNMSSTNSPLSLSSVNCEVDNKQRAATIVEGGPKVKTVLSFFNRSLTSTLLSECAAPSGSKMFVCKRTSAPARSTDSLSVPHDGCTLFMNVSDMPDGGCWGCSSVRRASSFACLLAEKAIVGSLSKQKQECTVENSDVGIYLLDLEMLMIRFSSKCAVTKWTSHRNGSVMEESMKQVPARHTDQHRHTNSMTQRRTPNQIERLLCQHGTAFVKTKRWGALKPSKTQENI